MSEEHLDLLAILARLLVRISLGNVASDIPCRFMDAASDLPSRCIRTAASLSSGSSRNGLAGSIDEIEMPHDRPRWLCFTWQKAIIACLVRIRYASKWLH
jgi:hypothetical protein